MSAPATTRLAAIPGTPAAVSSSVFISLIAIIILVLRGGGAVV
jgi:hypothetical protein